jgi:HEXXH motif-containing protein
MKFHRLPAEQFEALARRSGDLDGVLTLRTSQYSRRVLLLRALLERASQVCPNEFRLAGTQQAFDVLARAQQRRPEVLEEILLFPPVGAWLGTCLRRMGERDANDLLLLDLAYLGAIAASAAIRAGECFSVHVPVVNGSVYLPLWGTAELPAGCRAALVVLRTDEGRYQLECDGETTTLPADLRRPERGWRPVRQVSTSWSDQQLGIVLDDVDPYRQYHGLQLADALPESATDRWTSVLDGAWALLVRHHRDIANSIAAGLSSIVPLAESDQSLGGTSSESFGAAALSLPADEIDLAVALVHEFQHSKLGALLDLVPLLAARTDPIFYAPWREDPRPLHGLLQGCYAYFGVAGFWRTQCRVAEGRAAHRAHFEFALWRRAAWLTSGVIAESGLLTVPGRRFIDGMHSTLASWQGDQILPASLTMAHLVERHHRLVWRLRNLRPDETSVQQLASAWRVGRPCPEAGTVPTAVVTGAYSLDDSRLRKAIRGMVLGLAGPSLVEPAPGDTLLFNGEHAQAALAYLEQIQERPACLDAWAGYALAQHASDDPVSRVLRICPEVVYAVHSVLGDEAPDPWELASWLAPVRVAEMELGGGQFGQRLGGSRSNTDRLRAVAAPTSG